MSAEETRKVPRMFVSPAYLVQVEKGTYGLYRNVEVETDQVGTDGKKIREKVRSVGPMKVLREALSGEERLVVLETFDVVENRPLKLIEINGT